MTVDIHGSLETSRRLAAYWILIGCAAFGVVVTVVGLLLPISSPVPGVVCFGSTLMAFLAFRTRHKHYCVLVGQAAVAQAIGLVAALSGTDWQSDGHMLFYVALAALVGLVHVPTFLFAAATVVLHHLALAVVFPHLVFPSVNLIENIERALFHGAAVALQVFILTMVVRKRVQMTQDVQAALNASESALASADEAGQQAEAARAVAEAETARAQAAQSETENVLKALEAEQAAREQANLAEQEKDARTAQERQARLDAQTNVVTALREGLENIAQGNLTHRIDAEFPDVYEPLRQDFNRTVANLQNVLTDVTRGTADLMGLVSAVQTSAHDLAQRTEAQVASLEVTSHAVDTLHGAVRASTENAQATASSADKVRGDAKEGGEMVHRVVDAMSDIENSSYKIAKINAVMDSIAFQTNLLALNAGVEAARAGEAGRGFSVVASEVRALSRRATDAARSITELTESSTDQVQSGVALVKRAGEALEGIVSSVSDMTGSVQRIAAATQSQSDQLSEVNVSVSEMDKVAQENAAMFDETNTACTSLMDGLQEMMDSLAQFRLEALSEGCAALSGHEDRRTA
ncbi:methyl-accepting chemotaxis protein [uncultured Tateyamaria sp.]|uniref:methyl-accepting chemotaxis protein n=1 Tax=Tateyamaria sp. 1078 TaxID=3417464 RepID=UPI00261C26F5|nr:methyl-accepting chemotaxis protein [uncultured Tateyamaria sp.]